MLGKTDVNLFSHVKPGDTPWRMDGLRDFFLYRDLGVANATGGRVIAQLVKANPDRPPEHGTGWHQHIADFHIVIMTKGWARFMYGDKEHLVAAGRLRAPAARHHPLSVRLLAGHGISGNHLTGRFRHRGRARPMCGARPDRLGLKHA